MKFGPVPVADAAGAILAHSVRAHGQTIRKGVALTPDHVAMLAGLGVAEVIVARLEAGDVHEDAAAAEVAAAVTGEGVRADRAFTGRVNLVAVAAGLAVVDTGRIAALNAIDPAITIATVPPYAPVAAGEMVATIKIIPFAVPRGTLDRVQKGAGLRVAAFRPLKVGLVATLLPSLKAGVMDNTRTLLDARLAPASATVVREDRVAHEAGAVAEALAAQARDGAELLIVFGASAVVDGDDVIPAAIREAGGRIERLGMPVDPGNLIVLGALGGLPVIGAPGCARSPKENGFDWVLRRLLAGISVSSEVIAALGVGGLLKEIPTRPQPRAPAKTPPRIAALVLAAGQSRRMGGPNKLVAKVDGVPLVRIATEAALRSRAMSVTVVTGHRADETKDALAGLDVRFISNPDYAAGLSTSLKAGLATVPDDADGVVVLLADMPTVTAAMIDRLIAGFAPGRIVVPVSDGQRGNPVLWSRAHFPALGAVTGDAGGRGIIEGNPDAMVTVDLGPAAGLDVDTPEALAAVSGAPG